mmetsp:Transcript_4846/g.11302  ORF Transcript_4846/g.11302 Transcript_4846/m.11302 type:complete len:200 (+) Transcript_4846:82-681(+)
MRQQMQLQAEGDHCPVLEAKLSEEGHAISDVADVLNPEDIEAVEIKLRLGFFLLLGLLRLLLLARLLRLLLLLLLLLLGVNIHLLGLLLGGGGGALTRLSLRGLPRRRHRDAPHGAIRRLPAGRGLPKCLLIVPLQVYLLPLLELHVEPGRRSEVFDAGGEFPGQDPLPEVVLALVLLGPLKADLLESFRLLRQRELCE